MESNKQESAELKDWLDGDHRRAEAGDATSRLRRWMEDRKKTRDFA